MKKAVITPWARRACGWLIVALCVAGLTVRASANEPTPVLFDTDMDTDCDDAGALAVLHALADRGEVEILATVVSSRYRWSAPCVEAINRYYGRGDLPIGSPKGDGASTDRGSRYAKHIARQYSTSLKTNDDATNAVKVYRRVLASQPDRSVTIVTVGYLTNLRDLLASGPDEHSELAGPALVQQKVRSWVCMGGRYPEHLDPGVYGNFKPDPASAVAAVQDWPTPIVFSGLGEDVLTGRSLRQSAEDNPVRRAYELYLGEKPARPSWDPIAVLYAARPNADYWKIREGGHNHIFANGTNQWREKPDDARHRLLLLAPGSQNQLRKTLDRLMALPPEGGD